MADASTGLLEMLLRDLGEAGPEPWYPADYARATGLSRGDIDTALDQLRMAGLVRLTEWVQGRGQGYEITYLGRQVLANPRQLERLREGKDISRRAARDEDLVDDLRDGPTTFSRGEAIRNALLDPRPPVVTKILIVINIAVFLWGLVQASQVNAGDAYLGFGGGNHAAVVKIREESGILHISHLNRGEWWRLVTYCFVHIGLIHLLMNMFVLYSLGSVTETLWGPGRYLALYLIAGVVGGVGQVLSNPLPRVGGASGSICGLLGSMGVWVMMNKAYLPPRLASEWMRNVMMNVVLIALISMMPGVSWAGHLGGGLAGVFVSIPLNFNRFGQGSERVFGAIGVALVPILSVGLLYWTLEGGRVELDPDDPQVENARKHYRRYFLSADSAIHAFHENHAKPFLDGAKTPKDDPEAAKAAVKAAEGTRKQLEGIASHFKKKLVLSSNRTVNQHVDRAGSYVRDGARFCEEFTKVLEPEKWTVQARQIMRENYRRLQKKYQQVADSEVFKGRPDAKDE